MLVHIAVLFDGRREGGPAASAGARWWEASSIWLKSKYRQHYGAATHFGAGSFLASGNIPNAVVGWGRMLSLVGGGCDGLIGPLRSEVRSTLHVV